MPLESLMNPGPVKTAEILLLLCIAVLCDLKTHKIKNRITFPFMLMGAMTNLYTSGIRGLTASLLGWGIPILLLYVLYRLKMLGAGDIKLFAAMGSIAGHGFILYSMAYSFLCAGAIGMVLILLRRNGVARIRYFCAYVRSCLLTFSLRDYSSFKDKDRGGDKFHFSLAILAGTLIQLIQAIFNKGGAL